MGSGTWSASTYDRITGAKMRSGSTFAYTSSAFSTGIIKPHDTMNPKTKDGKPAIRESRDSDEHPNSTPITIVFDETGSMGDNPSLIQRDLKKVFGMLVRKDIVEDPQIAIGAYGDAYCDDAPLQYGQFESDNRIDDEVDNILIERGGGGNNGETSTLAAWYIANNTVTDSWEKRNKKGYAFFIGDECALPITREQITDNIGDDEPPMTVSPEKAFRNLMEKWNVYFLVIDNYAAKRQHSREKYSEILGPEHVIMLRDGSESAATIVSIIGACEATADTDSLSKDLVEAGFSESQALAAVNNTRGLYRPDGNASKAITVEDTYSELDL